MAELSISGKMKVKTCNRAQVQHGWKVIWYDIQTFHPTQLMHDLQSTPSESLSTNNTNSKIVRKLKTKV